MPYTLLYLPIEGAALAALERSSDLLSRAHRQRVVLVTPSTLFLAINLVSQLWRVAAKEAHAHAVAAEGGRLLQRLEELVADFSGIGQAIESLRGKYAGTEARLHSGPDNALAVAQRMKLLHESLQDQGLEAAAAPLAQAPAAEAPSPEPVQIQPLPILDVAAHLAPMDMTLAEIAPSPEPAGGIVIVQ